MQLLLDDVGGMRVARSQRPQGALLPRTQSAPMLGKDDEEEDERLTWVVDWVKQPAPAQGLYNCLRQHLGRTCQSHCLCGNDGTTLNTFLPCGDEGALIRTQTDIQAGRRTSDFGHLVYYRRRRHRFKLLVAGRCALIT